MTVQTEIKNEKLLFATLIKKIQQSKTLKKIETKSHRKYTFDTFVVDIELGGNDEHQVFSVLDKQGKTLLVRDCGVPDVEGDALKICEARWNLLEDLWTALNKREEQEMAKEAKTAALKEAQNRVKLTKAIRAKQVADAAKAQQTIDKLQRL
ncbi:MAG: hypothetical protein J6W08_01880 [Alphaproteobacteria bacterium]|nr:hypothetical protein [Alphaproteobacteria bacterium]